MNVSVLKGLLLRSSLCCLSMMRAGFIAMGSSSGEKLDHAENKGR